jgi:23S rRNA (cytidine1920-2'-O)/16S rRNA (cytidine1409-2'-O)-methyltransferase
MTVQKKLRLDHAVAVRFPQYSHRMIQGWIMQGKVRVNDMVITKPGTYVTEDAQILCTVTEPQYVSRGGLKLEKALEHFNVVVEGLVVLDAGISTGGFTDCLIQQGAQKIFGVDVGYGQVHEKIRENPKVIIFERTHLKDITVAMLGEHVDLCTLDLSFISVTRVLDAVIACMNPRAAMIILIKPQFEAGRYEVGRGGIVRDPAVHHKVIQTITGALEQRNFSVQGVIESPLLGTAGNKEFLLYTVRRE